MRKALSCRGRRLDDPLTRQRHRKSIYSSVSCKTLSACGLPPVSPTAAAVRRVAAPYKLRVNKFVQILRTDNIRSCSALIHYSLLLITLSVSETTPQSRFTPSQLPYRGGSLNRFCDKTQFINHKTDRSISAAVGYCFTAPVYVPGTFLIPYCLYSCRPRVRLRSRPPLRWSAGALPLCGSRPR